MSAEPRMDEEALRRQLAARTRFRRLVFVPSCPSTQTLAEEDREAGSALYWADHQVSGRGRHGRSWDDDAGQDLALTFRLADTALPWPGHLAPAVPVAALLALEGCLETPEKLQIKWPNDLLLGGRKLCGILIDSQGSPGPRVTHLIGIGINVNRSRFPEELQEQATSLALATGREFDRGALVLSLAEQIEEAVQALERDRVEALEDCFRQRMGLLGSRVILDTSGGGELRGRLSHLDFKTARLDGGEEVPLAHVLRIRAG